MSVTRYELDAKLEIIESRMDARVQHIKEDIEEVKHDNQIIKQELRNTQWWVLGTGVAIIGVMVAVLTINSSWQQTTINLINSKLDTMQQQLQSIKDK